MATVHARWRILLLALPAALVPVACTSILGDFTTKEGAQGGTTTTTSSSTGGGGGAGATSSTTGSTSSAGGSGAGGMDAGIPPSPECIAYCDEVMAHCVGNYQQYTTKDDCLAVCMAMPPGKLADDDAGTPGDGLACRKSYADLAVNDSSFCPPAGPDGAGSCGGYCDAFCEIAMSACPGVFADADHCKQDCQSYPPQPSYGVGQISGNSYGCRMYVLTQAALDASHCPDIGASSSQCRCDQSQDCNGCASCAVGPSTGKCTTKYVACLADQTCTQCSDCAAQCQPGDQACYDACVSAHPTGCQLFDDFVQCYLCDQCTGLCNQALSGYVPACK